MARPSGWDAAPVLQDGERIRLRLRDGIAAIEHRNPANGCFDAQSEAELTQALDHLDTLAGLRVIVLTGGAADVFIRHYDLQTLRTIAGQLQRKGLQVSLERPLPEAPFPRLARRLAQSRAVTIAAINGVAMGGGLELALCCDIRIAQAGQYPIGLPELGVGILPGAGGTQRLPGILGAGRTLYNLLTARMYGPDEALQAGLVDECVPDVRARALAIAQHVCGLPERACAHAKQLVRAVGTTPPELGMAHERTLMVDCLVDPQAVQRLDAVLASGQGIEALSLAPPQTVGGRR